MPISPNAMGGGSSNSAGVSKVRLGLLCQRTKISYFRIQFQSSSRDSASRSGVALYPVSGAPGAARSRPPISRAPLTEKSMSDGIRHNISPAISSMQRDSCRTLDTRIRCSKKTPGRTQTIYRTRRTCTPQNLAAAVYIASPVTRKSPDRRPPEWRGYPTKGYLGASGRRASQWTASLAS